MRELRGGELGRGGRYGVRLQGRGAKSADSVEGLVSEVVSLSLNLPEVTVELPRTVTSHRVAATRVMPCSTVALSVSQSPFCI